MLSLLTNFVRLQRNIRTGVYMIKLTVYGVYVGGWGGDVILTQVVKGKIRICLVSKVK